jgi:hypothetical protein
VSSPSACEQDSELPPPGSRSGWGAESVLPYLTRSLQARPAHAPEPCEPRGAVEWPSASRERPGWLA